MAPCFEARKPGGQAPGDSMKASGEMPFSAQTSRSSLDTDHPCEY